MTSKSIKALAISGACLGVLGTGMLFLTGASEKTEKVDRVLDMAEEVEQIYNSPILQIEVRDLNDNKKLDTLEFKTFEVAAEFTEYDSSVILQSIIYKDNIDGYEFARKE